MNKTNTAGNKTNQNSPLPPYIAKGSTIWATPDEISKRKKQIEDAERIGEQITMVDGTNASESEYENPYRVEALYYIANGLEVPMPLIKKIDEFEENQAKL